ncbi:MAG TPA: alpha-1,6-glucosidase domain-containing protein, partial [Steroidobacteraceae bacterium]
ILSTAHAIWLDATTIVWPGTDSATYSYRLYYSATAALAPSSSGVSGADNPAGDTLTVGTLSTALKSQFPQFATASALQVPVATQNQIRGILRNQLAVVQYQSSTPLAGTAVQIGPVLDAVYAAAAAPLALGLSFSAGDVPTFRLWAPTANSAKLNLYASASATTATSYDMVEDTATGVWAYTAPDASWTNSAYFTYSVNVFSRWAGSGGAMGGAVITNEVTDPYSVSLSGNSRYSMVLNIADAIAQPLTWPGALIPTAAAPTDSVIYELHLRDFSANDSTVPAAHAGRYLAFTDAASAGRLHLSALAAAGLTHVHLLPVFDIASVDEIACTVPTITASTGSGTAAETDVKATQNTDCFNWGYDPLHFGAPEGLYSSNPDDGLARVVEFRQMGQALHSIGLRVIMDVVYNHTSASGQDPKSVLDRLVPGYYHRLNANGAVENHSCCADTATERTMMAKLMTDTLVMWADQYKIDGFRFDVMGQIPKSAVLAARTAVDAITAADGRGHTYFYGEGWDQGAEVDAAIAPAIQAALAGTGIGTFNDRLRDGARGGSPFDSGAAMVANQGFVNGLCYDPASTTGVCSGAAGDAAFDKQNRISIGLAGNLASFPGVGGAGFGGIGYAGTPQENIAYVSVHDGETLFDISQYRHPAATTFADAGRAQVVGLSLALLAQGVPFIHAGDELLRSKSGDSNSYNSGDYFNRIYWDGSANNWAVGLPPDNTGNNAANAATLGPILDRALPSPASMQATILATSAAFQDLLRIRRDTDLFRLSTATDINNCLSFPDQGAQVHGLIVERILGHSASAACPSTAYRSVLVLYNASSSPQTFVTAAYAGKLKGTATGNVYLHPAQFSGSDALLQAGWNFSADATAGSFTVPARTTGVFVEYN